MKRWSIVDFGSLNALCDKTSKYMALGLGWCRSQNDFGSLNALCETNVEVYGTWLVLGWCRSQVDFGSLFKCPL